MSGVEPIYSDLAADPILGEIVEIFLEEIPARIDTLVSQAAADDREALGRTAHQLKGAFGSHGFDQLTPSAKRLETAAREGLPEEELSRALNELVGMCQRLRRGTPENVAPGATDENL